MRHLTRRSWVALALLALALGSGLLFRAGEIGIKRQFSHDEIISYIAATGHQDRYQWAVNGGLTDRWVPASEWKSLTQPGSFWDFGQIRSGLAHTDTHPPLYFWILHVWVAIFGVSLRWGLVLNAIIATLTGVVLFLLARRLLRNSIEAALVVLVWTVSPPVLKTSMMARHYDLFALMTVIFAFLVVRAVDLERPFRWRDAAVLAVVTAAGVLTHYQFSIVAVTGGLYACFVLLRRSRPRLWRVGLSMVAGAPIFVALAPQFYLSVRRQQDWQAHGFSMNALNERIHEVWSALYPFFGLSVHDLRRAPNYSVLVTKPFWSFLADGGAARAGAVVVLLAAVALAVCLFVEPMRSPVRRYFARVDTTGMTGALFFLIGVLGGIFAMYLAFRSPHYAVGDHYQAAGWVFLAFTPVLAARLLPRRAQYAVVIVFWIMLLMPAGFGRLHTLRNHSPNPRPMLAAAHRVVLDGPDRGNGSRVLFWLPDKTMVYAAWQTDLLSDPSAWIPEMRPRDVLVDMPFPPNKPIYLDAIKGLLAPRLVTHRTRLGVLGVGRTYLLLAGPGVSSQSPQVPAP